MRKNIILEKTAAFSIRIVNAERYLRIQKKEVVMSKQLLRSGTSIGANCAESQNAQSPADFISKLSIALKEADETRYWLNLLHQSNYINEETYDSIINDVNEIIAILTRIIISTKNNNPEK